MLEQRVLLLRPRTASAVQAIADGESGAPLGFARWQAETPSSWRRLFGRSVLAVHEQEDEPLLFTVRRAWSLLPRREVRDAEDQPIGSLLGRLVQDQHGRVVASLQDGVFRSPRQHILAELVSAPDGLRLCFHAGVADEPFVKMLLLAAALQMTR
ncbi:MAG TPA: hypothetical protein VH575_10170 [Gemmataceae bacterium]|jgi:hypothetical protein